MSGQADADHLPDAIHRIRRATRHLRALARLLRPSIGGRAFRGWNDALRDQARRLADARDQEVVRGAIERIVEHEGLDRERYATILAHSTAQAAERSRKTHEDGAAADVAGRIAAMEPSMAATIPETLDAASFAAGAGDSYRRVRRQFDRARKRGDPASMHEWRKRVKIVRAHVECIPFDHGTHGKALASRLKELTDVLGSHHDLELVQDWAARELAQTATAQALLHELVGRCFMQQQPLLKSAIELGEIVCDDRPTDYAARVHACLLDSMKGA